MLCVSSAPCSFPQKTEQTCHHDQFIKGKGCVKHLNWEIGGKQRATLDRGSPLFQSFYSQRTGCERINARAKESGIERPRVRNGRSVANLNTLIYVIVNVRVLLKAKSINTQLRQMNELRLSLLFTPTASSTSSLWMGC